MDRPVWRAYRRARLVERRARLGSVSWTGVRIFGYHRVYDAPTDQLAVAPRRFRAQLRMAVESGAQPLRLTEALDKLGRPVGGRWFCVTLDDGYRDNLENAAPILAEMRIPATVFVATDIVGGGSTFDWYEDPPAALNWDEVRELHAGGLVEIASHTRTHTLLTSLDEAGARDEVVGSYLDLCQHLGCLVTSFAYPAGKFRERDVALVSETGYRSAVTTRPGVNTAATSPFLLRRSMIGRDVDERRFLALLDGLLDDLDPLPAMLRRLRVLQPS